MVITEYELNLICYKHILEPNGPLYIQSKDASIPQWAYDVKLYSTKEGDSNGISEAPNN